MADFIRVVLNEPAIAHMVHDPRSHLIRPLLEVTGEVTERGARRRVPVATGHLYDSVALVFGEDEHGAYARVQAAWYDVFLEKPARQMKRARRSLRTALRDIPRLL
jgi:hypothetical protein